MESAATDLAKLDDRACADRLAALRWPEGFRCQDCGESRHYRLARRPRVFECARCRHQQSVTSGTVMHRSRVPLACWFVAAGLMTRVQGISAAELERQLGVAYETAWQLLHKLRAALSGEPRGVISGLAEVAMLPIPMRPPRGERGYGRSTGKGVVRLLFGVGAEGTFVVVPRSPQPCHVVAEVRSRITGPIVTSGPLIRIIAALTPIDAAPRAAFEASWRLRKMLLKTHRSVSRTWLGRYLGEFGYRSNHAAGPDDIVTRALAAPWLSFGTRAAWARAA